VADLIVERLDLPRLDDVQVVAQAVEELRAVHLRIDRLQLDALDERVVLAAFRGRVLVAPRATLPDAGHRPQRPEVRECVGIDVSRLGEDVRGFHARYRTPRRCRTGSTPRTLSSHG